jgi:hypothetical protein
MGTGAMRRVVAGFALAALMVAVVVGFAKPAAAEFFGCNDRISSRIISSSAYRSHASTRYTHEFAAQSSRRHVTRYPRTTYRHLPDRWR